VIQMNKLFKGRIENWPDMMIFDDLYKTKVQLKIRYTKEGKIPKVNDDQFENAYRLSLLDIEYVDPIDEDDWRNEPEKKILSGVDAGY